MLAVVQFPIADSRRFRSAPSGRLPRPDWPPQTTINPQFVRRFGPAEDRRKVADKAWADEHAYCQASRALAMVRMTGWLSPAAATFAPSVAFRRLLVDESQVVGRVEVGIAHSRRRGKLHLDQASCMKAIGQVLELETRVPEGAPKNAPLITQGGRLARLYRRATTQNGVALPVPDDRIVEAGEPLVVLEFLPGELDGPLEGVRRVLPEHVAGADLAFRRVATKSINGTVGVWFIRPGSATPDALRRLRLCLMRLHAERECLDSVLRQIQREAIRLDDDGPGPERLQEFLNAATRLLSKESWNGLSQSAILAAFDAADEVGEADEMLDLEQRLEKARRQVTAKVMEYARRRSAPRVIEATFVEGDYVRNENKIINSTLTNSPVLVGQMDNVLNNFQASGASDELKAAVGELHEETKKLMAQVDEKTAKQVADRVKLLTEQAQSQDPLEDVVTAAGNGLIKIGEGVKDLSEPIATVVRKVVSLMKLALI